MSRPGARGADGSEIAGEKRSRGGGAGVSGRRVPGWMVSFLVSGSMGRGAGSLGGSLSLSRGLLLGFLATSSLSSPILSFSAFPFTLTGEASGSVFTLSRKSVSRTRGFSK